MYGGMHKALTQWVLSMENGEDILAEVLKEIDFEGSHDDFFREYTDNQTMALITAVSKVTGIPLEDCKFHVGRQFVVTILDTGYGATLLSLGNDFYSYLKNMDSLHDSFVPSFPDMKVGSLRPKRNPDNTVSVHYYSQREGLASLIMGLLKESASRLFDLDIDITHRVQRGRGSGCDIFEIVMDERGFGEEETEKKGVQDMCTLEMSTSMINHLFPWHFAIDENLNIVSLGKHLASRLKENHIGQSIKKAFSITSPIDARFDFEMLKDMDDVAFQVVVDHKHLEERKNALNESALLSLSKRPNLLACPMTTISASSRGSSARASLRGSGEFLKHASKLVNRADNIKLHGQMTYNPEQKIVMFLGVPALRSLEEMDQQNISISEMPLHSHGREFLYGAMFQSAAAKDANEIDERLAALDKSMLEVQQKKEQIDNLLHSILPPVVANSLARGDIPPAERYDQVTVLFSDIVGFTNISANVPATEVMDMLHTLFLKFDGLAEKHGCYKVETIGDAYMVAAGCPEECSDHALRIGRMAIDMVRTAKTIISPLDGEPLRVRIGVHSGPLMAGVVGRARPRYCLFGDTVNVASRMESNGLPGSIQVSYRFVQALPLNHPFTIVSRGHIEIKGKGFMKTFVLLGARDQDREEPLLPVEQMSDDLAPILYEVAARDHDKAHRVAILETALRDLKPHHL
eukprot:m.62835 g.62835  ORF g.62835 m.62835 type:complete len:690 (+) comp13416_c0_seq1:198-2267(+)